MMRRGTGGSGITGGLAVRTPVGEGGRAAGERPTPGCVGKRDVPARGAADSSPSRGTAGLSPSRGTAGLSPSRGTAGSSPSSSLLNDHIIAVTGTAPTLAVTSGWGRIRGYTLLHCRVLGV